MSRHVTSCHVMSRHVTSCPVMSRHVISCYVISRRKSRDGHATNASLSTDFFHTQSIQIKHDRVCWLSRRLGCRYNTASAVYDLVGLWFSLQIREVLLLLVYNSINQRRWLWNMSEGRQTRYTHGRLSMLNSNDLISNLWKMDSEAVGKCLGSYDFLKWCVFRLVLNVVFKLLLCMQ